jgi:TrmH family RNA methyltransferase
MLSKNSIKFINSLRVKKYRNEAGLFVAEGDKLVEDILVSSLQIKTLFHTSNWGRIETHDFESKMISSDEMKKISGMSSPSNVLAIVYIPEYEFSLQNLTNKLTIALDWKPRNNNSTSELVWY